MSYRIGDIATALGAEAAGDTDLVIAGAAEPARATASDLAIALSPDYAAGLVLGQAQAALLWPGADWRGLGLKAAIFAPRGRLALARLTGLLDPGPDLGPDPGPDLGPDRGPNGRNGLHPTALIDPTALIGDNVRIGPYCVIGALAVIGSGTRIGSHVTIAGGAIIGPDGLIHPGVRIGSRVRIGARVILQPNVVIGGDGFSFVTETPSHVEIARATLGAGEMPQGQDPTWHRIHSLGGVLIGDDVEIGAGSTVDAGTIRATEIGHGTKIDNLVQIGHNVAIGAHCLLSAQAGVAGSARIGDRVVIGGKAGVADNITVGDDVVLSGGTIALSNVPAGRVMMGYPAVRMDSHIASYKALRRLPRLLPALLRDRATGQKPVSNPGESD